MDKELEQMLSTLRTKYQSPDNQQILEERIQEFKQLSAEREVLDSPQFKTFATTATKKLNELNAVLMNDESVLNDKGKLIAKERELWRTMLASFSVETTDAAREALKVWFKEQL